MLKASEKGAAHTENWLTFPLEEIPLVAGRSKRGSSVATVRRLCGILSWPIEIPDGSREVRIQIRNFAEKQGLLRGDPRSLREIPRASPLPTPLSTLRTMDNGGKTNPKHSGLSREDWRDLWNSVVTEKEGPASGRLYTRNPQKLSDRDGRRLDHMLGTYSLDELQKAAESILSDTYWADREVSFLTLAGVGNVERQLTKGAKAPETPKHGFQVHARKEG